MPAAMPATIPLDEPTVAMPGLLVLHVPPAGVLFRVVLAPAHILNIPVTDVGFIFTVTMAVLLHPVGKV